VDRPSRAAGFPIWDCSAAHFRVNCDKLGEAKSLPLFVDSSGTVGPATEFNCRRFAPSGRQTPSLLREMAASVPSCSATPS
jgi:hypothetical protein